MKTKLKRIVTNPRVLILFAAVLLSVFALGPTFGDGVTIQAVEGDGPAANATPAPISADNNPEITRFNGEPFDSAQSFYDTLQTLDPNSIASLTIGSQQYFVPVRQQNGTNTLGIRVQDKASTNLQLGLDLAGGTRVILEPAEPVNSTEQRRILNNIEQRINAFGLSDASVTSASDLSGGDFIIVEVPGVSQESVVNLLERQGRFVANIGDEQVFTGDDIQYICRQSQCSGLTPNGCRQTSTSQWTCGHRFSITISEGAAQNQADATRNLEVQGGSLSENITFIIDNNTVQSLTISPDLRGQAQRELSISGTGTGATQRQAQRNSLEEMRSTQAILETGSLPVELNIVKTDTISPSLGAEFTQSAIRAGLLAVLIVVSIVLLRYREWKISIPMVITMLSEVTILLGIASFIGWNIDMAAIAAIVITIGSSVDDQIVITDETLGRKEKKRGWEERMKKAFFIIFAAYFTLVVAMLPLLFAGAGLLSGFALTTVMGVTAGVVISRPAFAEMVEILLD
jgi:preprotein translocase subunit SecD